MIAFYMSFTDDENDKEKLEQLYYLYRKRMLKMAYSVLHNKSDAEDIVHETFIKIAKNMNSIDEVASNRTLSYVLRATKNTAINWNSKNKNSDGDIRLESTDELSDEDFCKRLEIKNDYKAVVSAIISLDEKYRDVLFYHFVYGMKVEETADLLGRKKQTAKQQLVRGKKLLLETLGKDLEVRM